MGAPLAVPTPIKAIFTESGILKSNVSSLLSLSVKTSKFPLIFSIEESCALKYCKDSAMACRIFEPPLSIRTFDRPATLASSKSISSVKGTSLF